MSRTRRNLLLLIAAIALCTLPLLQETSSSFTGTDNQATAAIGELAPDYRPWAEPLLQPDASTEKLLFAAQAGIGLAFIGYYLISRRRRRESATSDAA